MSAQGSGSGVEIHAVRKLRKREANEEITLDISPELFLIQK